MRKKMRHVIVMVLGFALTGAVLMGCGESHQLGQETQQGIPVSIPEETQQETVTEASEAETVKEPIEASEDTAQTAEKPVQTAEKYEDNFAVDSEAAKAFAEKIKDAAARKDLEALAELTAFPVYVGLPGVDVVETKEDFLKLGADAVFTDELLESIEKADLDHFEPCMAGFPISDGRTASINFGVADGVLAINGINY